MTNHKWIKCKSHILWNKRQTVGMKARGKSVLIIPSLTSSWLINQIDRASGLIAHPQWEIRVHTTHSAWERRQQLHTCLPLLTHISSGRHSEASHNNHNYDRGAMKVLLLCHHCLLGFSWLSGNQHYGDNKNKHSQSFQSERVAASLQQRGTH